MPFLRATDSGECPCGGRYEPRTADISMAIDGDTVQLPAISQGRCPSCGSRVYKTVVIEALEALYRGQAAPRPRDVL